VLFDLCPIVAEVRNQLGHQVFGLQVRQVLHDIGDVDGLVSREGAQPVVVRIEEPHRSPGHLCFDNSKNYRISIRVNLFIDNLVRRQTPRRLQGRRHALALGAWSEGFRPCRAKTKPRNRDVAGLCFSYASRLIFRDVTPGCRDRDSGVQEGAQLP
jgi:hypothetical protein